MSKGWRYKSGDWWVLCDSCNQKTPAHLIKKRWDGFMVCPDDWEVRHPQDFVKATIDKISVPFSRPRSTDTFVELTLTTNISDTTTVRDTTVNKDVYKVVPSVPTFFGTVTSEPLGFAVLGDFVPGGSGSSGGFTNQVSLQESIVLSYTIIPSDSISMSESLLVIQEYNKSLGSQTLGTITLG